MATRRWIVTLLALGAVSASFAQSSRPLGFLVRLGMFFPSALQARNESKNWTVFGVQMDLGNPPIVGNRTKGSLALSADTYSQGNLSALPVLLNYVSKESAIIFSVGAGASWTREARFAQAGLEKKSRTEFAWQVGLAYELSKYRFPGQLELRYLGNGYDTLSGFSLGLGLRF